MKFMRLLILAWMTAGLAACGGGSSGSPTATTSTDFGSQNYLLFASNSALKAFDPVTSTISTIPTNNPGYGAAVYDGTVDPTTGATSNVHISDVLYEDNGSFHLVSTAQSDKLAVSQVSSYSGTLCSETLTHNYLAFTDAGNDAACATSDDRAYAITTSMSSTDTPISLPAKPVAVLFSDYSTPIGLLYVSGGVLYFSNADGTNAQMLAGSVTSVSDMGVVGNSDLLDIDSRVEVFNGTTKTLIDSGYSASNILDKALSDGSNYYFFDGIDLFSVPVAGGSYAAVATVPATTNVLARYVYNNHLVYSETHTTSGLTSSTVDSVDLSTGSTYVLDTTYDPVSVSVVGYGGNYVYYDTNNSSSSDHTNDIAGAIKLDGTGRQEMTGASWFGAIFSPEMPLGQGYFNKYIVLNKYALDGSGNITGGDISIYDAASDAVSSDQGSLPAGIKGFVGFDFSEQDYYGAFIGTGGSYYLAHANATIANSMQQLDDTTAAVKDQLIK